MARETETINVFLNNVTKQEWTNEGGGSSLEAIGKTIVSPTAPETSKILKSAATTGKKVEGTFNLASGGGLQLKNLLANRAKVTAMVLRCYCNANLASKPLTLALNAPEVSGAPGLTASFAWTVAEGTKARAEELTVAKLEAAVVRLETILAKAVSAAEVYLSVEVETETAAVVRSKGSAKTSNVGGEVALVITEPSLGDDLFVAVSTAAGIGGGSSVIDTAGNTYTKNAEVSDGIHPTLQIWKAPVTVSGATEVKIKGLGASVPVNVVAVETTAVGSVDVEGTATGTTALATTEIEAATSATTNSGKGDFGIAFFASTGSLGTFTAGTGMTAFTGADQTGLSLGGEYTSTPAENAVLTAKGKFSEAGLWSGITVAYVVSAPAAGVVGVPRSAYQAVPRSAVI